MPTSLVVVPTAGIDPSAVGFFSDITSEPMTVVWDDSARFITVSCEADLSPATQAAIRWRVMARNSAEETLLGRAFDAMQDNRAFIASVPTQAQAVAQVKALSRQVNGLIRQILGELDGTD